MAFLGRNCNGSNSKSDAQISFVCWSWSWAAAKLPGVSVFFMLLEHKSCFQTHGDRCCINLLAAGLKSKPRHLWIQSVCSRKYFLFASRDWWFLSRGYSPPLPALCFGEGGLLVGNYYRFLKEFLDSWKLSCEARCYRVWVSLVGPGVRCWVLVAGHPAPLKKVIWRLAEAESWGALQESCFLLLPK